MKREDLLIVQSLDHELSISESEMERLIKRKASYAESNESTVFKLQCYGQSIEATFNQKYTSELLSDMIAMKSEEIKKLKSKLEDLGVKM